MCLRSKSVGLSGILVFPMKKQQALELLTKSKTLLQEKYGVTKLALFGSTARDTATKKSDIDILITFNGKADSKKLYYSDNQYK